MTKTKHAEPEITINGVTLSPAQAMALRVAVCDYMMDLQEPEPPGEASPIRPVYVQRLGEILHLMGDQ